MAGDRRKEDLMSHRRALVLLIAVLTLPGLVAAADYKIVKNRHTDPFSVMGHKQPAKDVQMVIWMGGDKMRIESPENTVIVRADRKKMYIVDPAGTEYRVLDLPVNFSKLMPPGMASQMMTMMAMTAKVTPTDETKKIGQWKVRRFDVTLSSKVVQLKQTVWTTQDVPVDVSAYRRMLDDLLSLQPGMADAVKELAKIQGLPILQETTSSMAMAKGEMHSREEVVSIEKVAAPAGAYDPPPNAQEKPFDLMEMMQQNKK